MGASFKQRCETNGFPNEFVNTVHREYNYSNKERSAGGDLGRRSKHRELWVTWPQPLVRGDAFDLYAFSEA